MSPSSREHRSEAREVAWLLSQLAERAPTISPGQFLGIWQSLEPRVLGCLRTTEREEGAVSGSIERLRNLTWEVAVTADMRALHCAALSRLAQLFNDHFGQLSRSHSGPSDSSAGPMSVFGIG